MLIQFAILIVAIILPAAIVLTVASAFGWKVAIVASIAPMMLLALYGLRKSLR